MKKVGLIGLSDPLDKTKLGNVIADLKTKDLQIVTANSLFKPASAFEKACDFNMLCKLELDAIFDVSGGDLANLTIAFLDFDAYLNTRAYFYGYSDLTVILNSLYTKTHKQCCLYQIRNNIDQACVTDRFDYYWLKHQCAEGIVVGGNIRCFLKLAGTKYFPDMTKKILFLESYSGNINRILSYFAQLEMMGIFEQISGLILGQFTELDQTKKDHLLEEYVLKYPIGILRTRQIGHSKNSKAIWIGKHYSFS